MTRPASIRPNIGPATPQDGDPQSDGSSGTVAGEKRSKTELTRQRILDSAAMVLRDKGYRHTRLADIARAAGIQAGAIYYHFDSRETLVEAVLNESTRRVSELVATSVSTMPSGSTLSERLHSAILAHLRFIHDGDGFVQAYFRIIDQVSPEMRSRHDLFEKQYGLQWQRLIVDGQLSGELSKDLDAAILRLLLLGSLQYTLRWFHPGGRIDIEMLADHAARLFLGGMEDRPPKS